MSPHPRRRTRLAGLLATTLAAVGIGIGGAPPASAFTADQATASFESFVDVFWDEDARYFFTYSDHRIHPEHAHGPQGGLYTDYWWEAQLWEAVMDRFERTGDPQARAMIDDVFAGFREQYPDFRENDWNDDIGWWALGSSRAYELTGDPQYLAAAEEMFEHVAAFEDDTYGGGIWWKNVDVGDGTRNQKNVATNAPAVVTAMRLHEATGDPGYRATAERIYAWLDGGFNVGGHLRDHVEGSGQYVDWDWTYNQGNFAAAALSMYLGTGDDAYLADATAAVDWALANLTSSGTLLREGGDDAGGFKAVLTRAMQSLVDQAGQVQYEAVLTENASQAARQVNAQGIGGDDWTAPTPDLAVAPVQSLAAGATVAVLQQAVPDGEAGVVVGTGVHEAENAVRSGISSESSAAGFSGRGYLAGWADDGTSVTFHVHVAEARAYPLELRYAAAAGTATRSLEVNGVRSDVAFEPTGSWDAWADVVVPVDLRAGHNEVVLAFDRSSGSASYLNLDRLTVVLTQVPVDEPTPEPAPDPAPGGGTSTPTRPGAGGGDGPAPSPGAPESGTVAALATTGADLAGAAVSAIGLVAAGLSLLRVRRLRA